MANAKVAITAENKMSPGLLQAKKAMMEFQQTVNKVGSTLKSAFGITTAIVAVKKLAEGVADSFKAFTEAERKYKQLSITLGNGKAFESVKQNIKDLSKLTLSSKDDIESMVSQLAGMGKSAEDVNAISEAAVYLSNVTGKDLNTSMQTLLKTYNGTDASLKKMGIDTGELTKEELKNGAAVQAIIDKYGELSRSMAEADNSQHIQNIKNNFGDIKQSIGDLVSFAITPLIGQVDAFSEKLRDGIDDFVQRAKVVIGNFPEIVSHLWDAIKSGLGKLFSVDGIKNLVNNIAGHITSKIKLIGNAVANISTLATTVFQEAIKGIGNYAMYWITSVTDKLGIDISEVVNSIGRWLTDSKVGQVVDQIISKVVNGVKLVGTLIKNLPEIVKIVVSHIGEMVAEFIKGFPQGIVNTFKGIGQRILAGILSIKNSFLQAVEDALNNIGDWISSTWVGKAMKWMGLDLGGKLAQIDFGIDRSSQYMHEDRADYYFSQAGKAWSGVKEAGAEMAAQINALLSPKIEQWAAESSETIGQKMAVWTAKSSEEYFKAAKQNFSNIGDFLEDWGKTFLSDLSDDWSDVTNSFKSIFGDAFGEDFDGFLAWFKPFMETNLKKEPGQSTGINIGTGSSDDDSVTKNPTFLDRFAESIGEKLDGVLGGTSSQWAAGASSALDGLTSNLGQAGTLVKELATNMATMGPVIGAIVTALKYVFEGFAEVISGPLNDFVQYGLEPLREIGRVIGEVLLPLFDALMPLVEESARFLIGLFDSIGIVLKPIIQMIGTLLTPILSVLTNVLKMLEPVIKVLAKVLVTVTGTIQYVVQTLQHWVAVIMNWLAGLNIFGWYPFEGLRMEDPGSPGKYGQYIQNKWGEIDAAFDKGVTAGTSTATSISSAGYQGATQIVINIYQQAPVVGDGGMRQFASMIRDEFSNLDYYGVTA